jgi:hypothetical protein
MENAHPAHHLVGIPASPEQPPVDETLESRPHRRQGRGNRRRQQWRIRPCARPGSRGSQQGGISGEARCGQGPVNDGTVNDQFDVEQAVPDHGDSYRQRDQAERDRQAVVNTRHAPLQKRYRNQQENAGREAQQQPLQLRPGTPDGAALPGEERDEGRRRGPERQHEYRAEQQEAPGRPYLGRTDRQRVVDAKPFNIRIGLEHGHHGRRGDNDQYTGHEAPPPPGRDLPVREEHGKQGDLKPVRYPRPA